MIRSRLFAAATAGVAALALAGCGSSGSGGTAEEGEAKVAILTSQTGALAEYGKQYVAGFKAGLDHATDGTGEVDGKKIDVTYVDDQGKPETAVSQFKDLVGKGYQIIGGTADSGIALQLAPLAEQNKVLYISGPAAVDQLTGINDYTFRSGRQTWQDVMTAGAAVGDVKGKKVVVFAQDYAFGEANKAAVETVLGGEGADVSAIMVPTSATDFTPFALKAKQAKPDLIFVAWAGDTTAAMWQALDQQGVLDSTTVVTGLATVASYQLYGEASDKIDFLSHYFAAAPDNEVNKAMVEALESDGGADLFSPDGFVAAQMMVHALEEGGDADAMVGALEGWTFDAPKGEVTIRESDHAMLQPMFLAKLVKDGDQWAPELVKTLDADQVAPPEAGS
jgi:branched-chain amino acid transport system substrate-binding protein